MNACWKITASEMDYDFEPLVAQDGRERIKIPKKKLLERLFQYPGLRRIFPNSEHQSIILSNVTKETLICLVRFLIHGSARLDNWKDALDTYAFATRFGVNELKYFCEEFFAENILTPENINEIHQLAKRMNINVVIQATQKFLDELASNHDCSQFSCPYCFVINSEYVEPFQLKVPLDNIKYSSLIDNFEVDVINEIILESFAKKGIYHIIGIQIKLKPGDRDDVSPLDIYVEASNFKENILFQEKRCKLPSPTLVIMFRHKLLLRPEQMASIHVIISDVKPNYCSALKKTQISKDKKLKVTFKSNRTAFKNNEARFFIEKIFYLAR
ncbi:uncharacterized protein LOC118194740 [Stegodyphus dumicola]|uniref:uncharacterized protein LOC118194740 n=1 Tax=Stegodyphus dumicola TaxID=202533 RepID=UPI0015AC26EB|nr:uncharacterized protein LOC118194740 [Stegodyphus dumicola]